MNFAIAYELTRWEEMSELQTWATQMVDRPAPAKVETETANLGHIDGLTDMYQHRRD